MLFLRVTSKGVILDGDYFDILLYKVERGYIYMKLSPGLSI